MDVFVIILQVLLVAKPVLGFGVDPAMQIDVINELDLENATIGITQVAGIHNNSKAFLFRDVKRLVYAPERATEKVVQLFWNKSDFTFLASIQQKSSTSGVILSIQDSESSYFELESSGLREEIRYRYRSGGRPRSESFPYRLADGRWHKLALTVSASHLLLHVDCHRIYERLIDPPQTELNHGSRVWLGQRNHKQGLFKGTIQDVKFIFSPNGYIAQCPNLNRTCPTCSDFLSLVQGIMDLQELLAKITLKLNYAETRQSQLELCHCERSCRVNETLYENNELWVEPQNCRRCTCKDGQVECGGIPCDAASCSAESLPSHVHGTCCDCRPKCTYMDRILAEGQRVLTEKSCQECKNGVMETVNDDCPVLNCSASEQVLPENRCCNICKDIDECVSQMHKCHASTVCVNLPGRYRCDCLPGFIRVDDYDCTEQDECASGRHSCSANAVCTSSAQGHLCSCKPGYVGNGTVCKAFCEEGCRSGGTCVSPNTCLCPPGFTGHHCETDIDECVEGSVQCHNHSRCINLPGWYHCECRRGFQDNGSYSLDGGSCVDIDECATEAHTCWNSSACVNLPGSFDCLCTPGPACTGDCLHEGALMSNGQMWALRQDPCSICSCRDGKVFCQRRDCDCQSPTTDLSCCPECDNRQSSQCLHQRGDRLFNSGENWIHGCQQCRCLEGEVHCWPLSCPRLPCEPTSMSEGECCPRCIQDPCLTNQVTYDVRKTCTDTSGVAHLGGSIWRRPGSPCVTCVCKDGHTCCSVDLDCLQNN